MYKPVVGLFRGIWALIHVQYAANGLRKLRAPSIGVVSFGETTRALLMSLKMKT